MVQLTDAFARKFYYLRLSITDVCNFRCTYCLPEGYRPDGVKSFLSLDEINRVSRAFALLGTEKIRLTGASLRCGATSLILLPLSGKIPLSVPWPLQLMVIV